MSRPSVLLLDETPEAPTKQNPEPHRLIPRWKKTEMQLFLRVMALSDHPEPSPRELIKHAIMTPVKLTFPYFPMTRNGLVVEHGGTVLPGPTERQKVSEEKCCMRNLSLTDFRPLQMPFVPDLICVLVSSIEIDCKNTSWNVCLEEQDNLKTQAWTNVRSLISSRWDKTRLNELVRTWTTPIKTATLRALLSAFPVKPLHLTKSVLKEFIKQPLYDQFLRPNPKIKALVRHVALLKTRTELDTLAFLMTHVIHVWESSANGIKTRSKLADIYGPLIISFTERPIIVDSDLCRNKTEEAALMEVILDVCDVQFWDHLGMLQIDRAFRRSARDPLVTHYQSRGCPGGIFQSMVENEVQDGDKGSNESFLRFSLRSTEALLRDLMRLRVRLNCLRLVQTGSEFMKKEKSVPRKKRIDRKQAQTMNVVDPECSWKKISPHIIQYTNK